MELLIRTGIILAVTTLSFTTASTYATVMLNKEPTEMIFSDSYIDLSRYEQFLEKQILSNGEKKLTFTDTTGSSFSPTLENKIAVLRDLIKDKNAGGLSADNLVDLTDKLNEMNNIEETVEIEEEFDKIETTEEKTIGDVQEDNNSPIDAFNGLDYNIVTFEEFINL